MKKLMNNIGKFTVEYVLKPPVKAAGKALKFVGNYPILTTASVACTVFLADIFGNFVLEKNPWFWMPRKNLGTKVPEWKADPTIIKLINATGEYMWENWDNSYQSKATWIEHGFYRNRVREYGFTKGLALWLSDPESHIHPDTLLNAANLETQRRFETFAKNATNRVINKNLTIMDQKEEIAQLEYNLAMEARMKKHLVWAFDALNKEYMVKDSLITELRQRVEYLSTSIIRQGPFQK